MGRGWVVMWGMLGNVPKNTLLVKDSIRTFCTKPAGSTASTLMLQPFQPGYIMKEVVSL